MQRRFPGGKAAPECRGAVTGLEEETVGVPDGDVLEQLDGGRAHRGRRPVDHIKEVGERVDALDEAADGRASESRR